LIMSGYGSVAGAKGKVSSDSNVKSESTPLIPPSVKEDAYYASMIETSSWWSRLTFGWFAPLLEIGNEKGKLDAEDLAQVEFPHNYVTKSVTERFQKFWDEELKAASQQDPIQRKLVKGWFSTPSLPRSLFRAFGREYIEAGFLKLVHDLCIFVGPQVLNGLIIFLRDPNAPMSRGLWLALIVTCSQLTMSLCLRHYFYKCGASGLCIRTSVVVAVYKKALVLAAGERQIRTTGEITNLISIDAQRMRDLTPYLHAIWYSFVQIGMAIYFLWQQLGSSCLGGVAVIIVMIPVTRAVAEWIGSLQKKLMKARDKRVELNSEILGSMKVVKLQAWEESFQDRILALRSSELADLYDYLVASCISTIIWSSAPLAVALATFTTYTLSGHDLDVASALTALALFDILRFPLFMLPQVINNIVEASISFNRVRSFLMCDDHKPVASENLQGKGLQIENASFAYETRKPKLQEADADAKTVEINDAKWEMALLKSQLQDAENKIRELVKPNSYNNDEVIEQHLESLEPDPLANLLCLKRICLETKGAEMIAVVGGVGSGKSSLLKAMLGEIRSLSGTTSAKGDIAYFSQNPFILNATVKANIIFGHANEPFDAERYKRALHCCALTHDLKLLPAGDMTEIGEKGVTLSGGQKARVAMARVVYHNPDICLLDDPLAAVDAHVGKHIFQKAIIDELLLDKSSSISVLDGKAKKRTVVLVTNAIQYLNNPLIDRIVVLKDGSIAEEGTYAELSKADSIFAGYLAVLNETGETDAEDISVPTLSELSESTSFQSLNELGDSTDQPDVARVLSPLRRSSIKEKDESLKGLSGSSKGDGSTLMTDELREREVGHVGRKVYASLARAAGGVLVPVLIIFLFILVECITVSSKWWLTYWSQHQTTENQTHFLVIYALINLTAVVATFFRVFFTVIFGIRASRKMFADILASIFKAPMWFFDTTPIGRIINRFSKDMYVVDEKLVQTLRSFLQTMFAVGSTIIVISGITPIFTVCLIPIIFFYLMQQRYFTVTYRELKRLDSVHRSPIYALLGETLDGVGTIRSFRAQDYLSRRLIDVLDTQQHAYFLTYTAQCWLAVRLELVGTLIITFAALCAVIEHSRDFTEAERESFAGLAGLSVSFALGVTQALNWSVRMSSDFEADMISVERIEQYINVRSEAPRQTETDKEIINKWPTRGEINLTNVKLRYRPGLPLVLKGLDLHIPGGSKVGVVGRTGAGKSTLMLALLRIVELDSGTIEIDSVDTSSLGLSMLRSNIAVVPQDPVLFSGSIRTNLDPFDNFSDDKLYDVLTRVGLYTNLRGNTSSQSLSSVGLCPVRSLEDEVTEGGGNFSVGQRQLLVIGRALLTGASIVVMDEATAAVDADTDARIQRVMRNEFGNATCITVAHRLNTIMDSDFILVMDDGRAAEFESPRILLERGGMFRELVEAAKKDGYLE